MRSRSCSPSRAPSSSCSASRPSRGTRRSRRRPRTRSACSTSPAAPTFPSPPACPPAPGPPGPLGRGGFVAAYVHGESGLDGPDLPPPSRAADPQHAVDFMAERIRPGTVLVPVGPLTNVALLLARHPDVAGRISRIVLMGGAIAEGNVTPAAEFNIWADPEAAARVFGSGLDVTMIGLDVTHKAPLTRTHAGRVRGSGRV